MSGILSILFAVMLLTDVRETVDREAAAAVSEDADRYDARKPAQGEKSKEARIRSVTADVDRKEGVILFEGAVRVDYADDYTMCSDQLFAFLSGSNELSRVVAVGNVSITNATRTGTCATAVYRRKRREIEMFGDGKTVVARLVDAGDRDNPPSEVEGGRIRFWLDSEQVEVEDSSIRTEGSKGKELAL